MDNVKYDGGSMTFDDLVKSFGTQATAAKALEVTPQAINRWKDTGIPKLREYQIRDVLKARMES